jgi:hypothetical protein
VHISFFEAGEAVDRELPAIGPLHGVLVRGDRLVVDHADVAIPDEPGIAVTRWLEGVVELQRATGETPGGRRRKSMRISAPDGLYLRFGSVGEPAASLREVGPFTRVLIGPRTIEAGGEVLATRLSGEGGMWTLTANADPNAVGAQRPDVGFRSASTPYHAWMGVGQATPAQHTPAPAAPAAPPAARPPAPPPTLAAPPPPPSQRVLKDSDLDLLERRARRQKEDEARAEEHDRGRDAAADARAAANARYAAAVREEALLREAALRQAAAREDEVREAAADKKKGKRGRSVAQPKAASPRTKNPQRETPARESVASRRIRRALESTGAEEVAAGGTNWLELAWRLRFAMLAVLVLGAGIYVFAAAQPRSATGQPQEHTYNLGQKINGVRWDYVVNGIQREPLAGSIRARGIFVAVRVTLTNRGADGAQASPNDFAIVDAAGTRYSPESLQSGVYSSPDNRSSFEWPTTYPPGRAVTTRVVFDLDTALTGLQLVISELPGTKVKIE